MKLRASLHSLVLIGSLIKLRPRCFLAGQRSTGKVSSSGFVSLGREELLLSVDGLPPPRGRRHHGAAAATRPPPPQLQCSEFNFNSTSFICKIT